MVAVEGGGGGGGGGGGDKPSLTMFVMVTLI